MTILAVDGNSIVNRAFYGVRPLTTRDGRSTQAIYGFLTMLEKITGDVKPDRVAIAFDLAAPTFRHKKYDGYKAKRKGMPEELAQQMQPLKDILKAMGYTLVSCEGWEADDILGTLASICREKHEKCVIATGDRDSLQLVGNGVTVRLLSTKEGKPTATVFDEAAVKEAYGVTPPQLKDIKAIQGDTSDNIPGVPGIGEKGARSLIERFSSLDGVYENLEDPSIKAGQRSKLEAGKESAYLSYWLGTIQCDAPIEHNLDAYKINETDAPALRAMLADLELFSIIKRMGLPEGGASPSFKKADSPEKKISFSDRDAALSEVLKRSEAKFVYSESENWLCLSFDDQCHIFEGEEAESFLREILSQKEIKKSSHDIKTLSHLFPETELTGFVMDTQLAAYLVNPSSNDYSLPRLSEQYLGAAQTNPLLERFGDAIRFSELCSELEAALEKGGMTSLLHDIELPLAIVLGDMERAGFRVDPHGIAQFGEMLTEKSVQLEQAIYAEAGESFNINSPKQLGAILFDKMALPGGKKTKTGWSTSADVLEELRGLFPIVDMVLEYRTLSKLNSTYCKGLLAQVAQDGRIHTTFNQCETRTGRISSAEPNLQNIPVRTELGREMRRFFIAEEGCVLVDADYSQIELRVLAHMAKDSAMTQAFNSGADIHTQTASQVFGVEPGQVTKKMRSDAKAVNFGIVYGISAFSLGKDIGVPTRDAQRYIDGYMRSFSGVAQFMKETVEQAKKDGFVQTLYGRRRYLPELASSNFNMRSFGERVARNMPIQGTAADIIKLAMVGVFASLKEKCPQARLIMQVHDELIIEVPQEKAELAKSILVDTMRSVAELSVELEAEAAIGKNWLEAK